MTKPSAMLVIIALLAGLSGCAMQAEKHPGPQSPPDPAGERTVTVSNVDVVPVVTFNATVAAPVQFQVTAPNDGIFKVSGDSLSVIHSGVSTSIALDARFTDVRALLGSGAGISAGQPIASVTFGGLALVAPLKPADILRFRTQPQSAKAELNGADGPFDCQLLDPRPSIGSDGGAFVGCIVPSDVAAIQGLTGVVAVRFPGVQNVPSLPIDAVAGSLSSGEVYKKVGEKFVVTKVKLGLSDSSNVQIVSGLSDGDIVRVPAPSLTDG